MSKINLAISQILSKENDYDNLIRNIYETQIKPEDLFYNIVGSCPEEILKHVLDCTLDALVGAGYGDRKEIVKQFLKHYLTWEEDGTQYGFPVVPAESAFIDLTENKKI